MSDEVTDRSALLFAAKWFLENIIKRDDIEKTGFLGSICTEKKHPKDIDILLYLKPDADMKEIAKLCRKFQGRISRNSMGADVFIVEGDKYIGRVCLYKEPWMRVVCAEKKLCCNINRMFLCNTSQALNLKPEIIANPPVVVYPEFFASVCIPNDLEKMIRTDLNIEKNN